MHIRRLDRANLTRAYGLDSERLLPWPVLEAPFEGAWCIVRPGQESTAHAHSEHEIFIAMRGSAVIESAGERVPFRTGDIVHFPPNVQHHVINDTAEDFEMYSVWWDADMATRFTARNRADRGHA